MTPVERLDELSAESGSELWVKRDDRTAPLYGGNKVRKLEYLLGDARRRGAQALITTGADGSHHCLATTLFGTRWGFDVHTVVVPQARTAHVEENLRCALGAGANVHRVRAWPLVAAKVTQLRATLTAKGQSPYWIPHGGSSAVGVLGYVEAGLELATQIDRGDMPEPDAIFVAAGSGGTCAGLAIGLAAGGLTTPIVGVRVTPRLACNRATLTALVRGGVSALRDVDRGFPAVSKGAMRALTLDSSYFGDGYGAPDPRAERAIVRAADAGLTLDATYTGRAFAAFMDEAEGDRQGETLLFWNTLSSVDLSERLESAPPFPD